MRKISKAAQLESTTMKWVLFVGIIVVLLGIILVFKGDIKSLLDKIALLFKFGG